MRRALSLCHHNLAAVAPRTPRIACGTLWPALCALQPPSLLGHAAQRVQWLSIGPGGVGTTGGNSSPAGPSDSPSGPSSPHKPSTTLYKDQNDTWVDRHAPASIKPYLKLIRIDRPIGTMLLLWPCWWSIAIAAPHGTVPDLALMATFGIGAVVMRGAGCTINDLWDKDFDAQVARTKSRPLASGTLTPFQAITFLGAQLSVGLAVLLSLNNYSIVLGAASLGVVIVYPLMKRFTYWPQLVLGVAFNWGALLGWAAVKGSLALPVVLPLFAGGIAWTLVYDTIYAHQDKADDAALGLKSTALLFGDGHSPLVLSALSGVFGAAVCAAGYAAGLSSPFYAGVGAAVAHLLWQVNTADWNDRLGLNQRFVSNNVVGALVFGGILAGTLV